MTTKITLTNIDSTGDFSELVDSAYNTANSAATNAISAGVYANAAFAKANTGSSSSSTNNARTMINAYVFGS
jgi:hypothetical protein